MVNYFVFPAEFNPIHLNDADTAVLHPVTDHPLRDHGKPQPHTGRIHEGRRTEAFPGRFRGKKPSPIHMIVISAVLGILLY